MKTIAIMMIAGATMIANHSFAQVRLGGGARLAAGASVSTPGINHAMRAASATVTTTSRTTVDAGRQAEVRTVNTTDKTVNLAEQSSAKVETGAAAQAGTAAQAGAAGQTNGTGSRSAGQTSTGANGQVNANVNGQVKTSANVHAAAAASAGKQ